MNINLAAIRVKLAAEAAEAATRSPTPTATATAVVAMSQPTPANTSQASTTGSTSSVMQQVTKLIQNIPADDPKLSQEENYLRQTSASEVQDKIQELQERLLSQHPTMPVLLQTIHKLLKQQPDNVTLLSDEQIGVIVSGLLRHTGTEIAAKAAGKKTKKVSQKLSLSDLGFD
jgi:hypothetical protein